MNQTELLYCSFCLKSQHEVEKLIAGPAVYVCDACVDLCNRIIDGGDVPTFAGWEQMSDDVLLHSLRPSARLVDNARKTLYEHVKLLRDRGVSWAKIGDALGVSRQAAWERFGA